MSISDAFSHLQSRPSDIKNDAAEIGDAAAAAAARC